MRVPPRSLAPASRQAFAPARPSFAQDTWIFGTSGCSTRRATACISSVSRYVGPGRDWPRRCIGASMCTYGSGTNSVMPPVRSCRSRRASRCRAQWPMRSTWPNMIVDVVESPISWAVAIVDSQAAVSTLSGQIMRRTSSSRISAAVPGSVARPASRSSPRKTPTGSPSVVAPCVTSSGENAWMWIPGAAAFAARQMSR